MKHFLFFLLMFILLFLPSCSASTLPTVTEAIETATLEIPTSTPAPTVTIVPTAVVTAKEQTFIFSPDDANKTPPEDILQEVAYYGSGGNPECINKSKPIIDVDPGDFGIGSTMITCGWKPGRLDGKITYPDGSVWQQSVIVDELSFASLSFIPTDLSSEGLYKFEISGQGVTLRSNAEYKKPDFPVIYHFLDEHLVLKNFLPNEQIRLFAYICTGENMFSACIYYKFIGWKEFTVNDRGDLTINLVDSDQYYFWVVTSSGLELIPHSQKQAQAILNKDSKFAIGKSSELVIKQRSQYTCPANIATHIKPDKNALTSTKAIVSSTNSQKLNMYANLRTNSRVVRKLSPGEKIEIYRGAEPYCAGGLVWWYVTTKNGMGGYVIEFDSSGNYFIEQR